MKPPWKFLAQLVSRRPPSETPDQTVERDKNPMPIESEVQRAPVPRSALPKAIPVPEPSAESPSPDPVETTIASTADVDTVSLKAGAEEKARAVEEQEQPLADVPAPSTAVARASSMSRGKPAKVARKGGANGTRQSPVPAGAEPVPQPPSVSANPFFDEAASLDEDIKQLKDQLAQKLRLQNAQLRKMLERFERS